MSTFKLTTKQAEAMEIISGSATHALLMGGSRSGKTFLLVRAVVMRALKAPNSRHAILRFRFNHIKTTIVLDTFPKVMEICFPGVPYNISKTDWFAELPNGSEIWFGGLDDKERAERILGAEYATIYLNEASQIPQSSRDIVMTRLAQKATMEDGRDLIPRMFVDLNPTSKLHWTYRLFIQKIDPDSKKPLPNPDDYVSFKMNPEDNTENLSESYLSTLTALPARLRKRFLLGEYADATQDSLFTDENFELWRVLDGSVPDMVRIVVAVDPSGAGDKDNTSNDAIGICVAGLGTDGNCYILEDLTVKAGPATWGRIVANAYERHEADAVVAETNYGGEMVRFVLKTAGHGMTFRKVTATRGKTIRAEPVSALYEAAKVRHVGYMRELEEELCGFTTAGFVGEGSPNRADAVVWAVTFLFPNILKAKKGKEDAEAAPRRVYAGHQQPTALGWMAA
jgi:phage terminase large subunit-like protein